MKSVKKNYIYNTIFQILKIALPVITAPYIARVLGANGNGIYGFTLSIATYFVIIGSVGIDLYGQREIAFVQNDKAKRSKVFYELFLLKFLTTLLSVSVFIIAFCINGDLSGYYRILIIEVLASALDISWLAQGMEDFKTIAIRNIVVKLLSVAAIFCFVRTSDDTAIYILIHVLGTLVSAISIWPSVKKYLDRPSRKLSLKRHIVPSLAIFLPQIAVQVYVVLDKTMIGVITNDMNEVGYYEQAQKIIKILLAVITSLGTVVMPRIAYYHAHNQKDEIQKCLKKSFSFVSFLAMPLLAGIIVASSRFVPIFFGDGYDAVVPIMQIMSPIVLLIGMSNVIGVQFLLPTKKQFAYTASIIAGAVTNVIFNLLLIPGLKSTGASIATVIAEFCVLAVQVVFARKALQLMPVVKTTIRYTAYSALMFLVCFGLGFLLPHSLVGLCIIVAAGMAVYFFVALLLRDPVLKESLNFILPKKLTEGKRGR